MSKIRPLEERRDQARSQFATLGDLRPGTLSRTASRCGKPSCHCAEDGDPGHPGHVLQRSLNGRQKSVRIRAHEVKETQAQVDEYRRFKALSLEFLEASEALAEAKLEAGRSDSVQKRGHSRRQSKAKYRRTSTA